MENNNSDITFITNEEGQKLRDRFNDLIKHCQAFYSLSGYFYLSGFHQIYKSLENVDKVKILIGIGTDKKTFNVIDKSESEMFEFHSDSAIKDESEQLVLEELENSEDSKEIELSIKKFVEWIQNGKLEIKAYPSKKIHSKLYIFTFKNDYIDKGRVITGSSNLTQAGLVDNLEFNVELKNRSDYEFALNKFNELWQQAVDLNENFVININHKTWLKDDITPYEHYLKFLYEYFKDELNVSSEVFNNYVPQDFKKFKYQEQAVLNAKRILNEYGGVFLSDVVGLGKTYIAAMLAGQLDGKTMVIAPPSLINKKNPGSWPSVFYDFNIPAEFVSTGNLDGAKEISDIKEPKNIIIDEAHRFRNENTISYEKLAEICRGKRVILVTATPFNNSPKDLLSLIKLFQNVKNSNIPGTKDLDSFFKNLEKKLAKIDRQKDEKKYIQTIQSNATEIRNKVLKYIMIRRTRSEIEKYFADDLKQNNLKFPEIEKPQPLYYLLNDDEDKIFDDTLRQITQNFKYARYTPLLYLKKGLKPTETQSQKNMGSFMKILLVKRLESSFHAFKQTIDRFIKSYENFIKAFNNGIFLSSSQYINKILDYVNSDDYDEIYKILEEGDAEQYSINDFSSDLLNDLNNDLQILKKIKNDWSKINRDPKLNTLIKNINNNDILKNNKIILFTESKETAEYLSEKINNLLNIKALLFHGNSPENIKNEVIKNFDANAKEKKDDYQILISTDVLSEGVNLHRANVVINYDIPWNPTKLIQRIGRINRVDTPFDKIYTFNFFPTKQAEKEINLEAIARSKIEGFLTLLGGDSSILTEGEPVSSHELFDKLTSKDILIDSEQGDNELKYLKVIEDIMKNHPDLFDKIKKLPKKARSAKKAPNINIDNFEFSDDALLTFFRKDKLMKFFITNINSESLELDFMTSASILESQQNEPKLSLNLDKYYAMLHKNKSAFDFDEHHEYLTPKGISGNYYKLFSIIKAILNKNEQIPNEYSSYLSNLLDKILDKAIPYKTVTKLSKELNKLGNNILDLTQVMNILKSNIDDNLLQSHLSEKKIQGNEKKEIILSLYLKK
ncbi:MAG TPA: helicase-related protein [Bacteroidales bacterium]|nr:helicase-related protein [Bacteroidales bacterium]